MLTAIIVGCSNAAQDKKNDSKPDSTAKKYAVDELEKLVLSKAKPTVRKLLGQPQSVRQGSPLEGWQYRLDVYNPKNKKEYQHVMIYFDEREKNLATDILYAQGDSSGGLFFTKP